MIVAYLMIPIYMGLLYMLSAEEKLPKDFTETGIQRGFQKIAAYIFRRFLSGSRTFRRSPSGRKVQTDLKTLNSKADIKAEETAYYIKKISTILMLFTVGSILATVSYISARRTDTLSEEGKIIRGDYGENEETR